MHVHKASFWHSTLEEDSPTFYSVSALILAFCVPLIHKGLTLTILLLIVAWCLSPKLNFRRNIGPILLFTALYLFHLIAMFYTENRDKGWADLMQKLSILLFPVLIGSGPRLKPNQFNALLTAFVWGVIAAIVLAFATSFMAYSNTGDPLEFYMSQFSPMHHPTYMAMYINFAAFILVYRIQKGYYSGRRLVLVWLILLILVSVLIFPASKAGFINFAILLLVYSAMFFSVRPRQYFVAGGIALIAIAFFALLSLDPVAQDRVGRAVTVTKNPDLVAPSNEMESSTARLIAWKMGLREIPKHPFGVGTGDIGDFLQAGFRADGYDLLADANLNLHNNYLQIALAQGILALALFVFSLIYPFKQIWKNRDWIYSFFLLSFLFHLLAECMLETQSGVIYFAFFNAILFFRVMEKTTMRDTSNSVIN